MLTIKDLSVSHLGECPIDSPLKKFHGRVGMPAKCVSDQDRITFYPEMKDLQYFVNAKIPLPSVEIAGPRDKIFFDPASSRAAIVSCGGLCPGINDVVRGIVMALYYRYGVKDIVGVRYGYQGFIDSYQHTPIQLTPSYVSNIHKEGGTVLGTSRGEQSTKEIIAYLLRHHIQLLFIIGGDGTMRAGLEIAEELERQHQSISIIGIPKTIDNDIMYIDTSFGFETAFSEAVKAITSAHNEALGSPNGIGLVKLMGRHSGFIACYAALAMNDVNFVLIPELPFVLEGESGFLHVLKERLQRRKHAVIVVAEGAGQDLMKSEKEERDASGNIRLVDIGLFLKERIQQYFDALHMEINTKYIDPSYIIRSVKPTAQDSVYCLRLAEYAVHAAMSGKTKMVVAKRHDKYIHLPMSLLGTGRKQIDPEGSLWYSVIEATGQPVHFI